MKPEGRIALFFIRLTSGGVEHVLVTLANALAEKGYAVDMVVLQAKGPFLSRLAPNVRLVDLGMRWYVSALPKLVAYLWRVQPRFLISGHIYMNTLAIAATLCNGFRNYLVVSEHGPTKTLANISNTWTRRMAYRFLPKLYGLADARVVVSKAIAAELQEVSGCKNISVIYNPVIDAGFEVRMQEPVPHQWLQGKTMPVLVAAGRLNYQKDFATLLRAFALLRQQLPVRLIILGEGEDRPMLTALVQELGITADVDLRGYVENVPAYLARADLFVLSSISEGLPTVIIEALAAGIPVVATNCTPGIAEVVDAEVGVLVPVSDPPALAQALHTTLTSPKKDSTACREKAAAFHVEKSVQCYLRVLTRLERNDGI